MSSYLCIYKHVFKLFKSIVKQEIFSFHQKKIDNNQDNLMHEKTITGNSKKKLFNSIYRINIWGKKSYKHEVQTIYLKVKYKHYGTVWKERIKIKNRKSLWYFYSSNKACFPICSAKGIRTVYVWNSCFNGIWLLYWCHTVGSANVELRKPLKDFRIDQYSLS